MTPPPPPPPAAAAAAKPPRTAPAQPIPELSAAEAVFSTSTFFRSKKKGLKSYQINSVKLNHDVGTSTTITNEEEEKRLVWQ